MQSIGRAAWTPIRLTGPSIAKAVILVGLSSSVEGRISFVESHGRIAFYLGTYNESCN
jgi:hypothetical protein